MNEVKTAWNLMIITMQSLPVWFWKGVWTFIGASFGLNGDNNTLFEKSRALFYGTAFGYMTADAIVNGFELHETDWVYPIFALFGIIAWWLASVILDAVKEFRLNWKLALPYIWEQIIKQIPLGEFWGLLKEFIKRKLKL